MEKMDEIVNIAVTDKSAIGKKHMPLKNRNITLVPDRDSHPAQPNSTNYFVPFLSLYSIQYQILEIF